METTTKVMLFLIKKLPQGALDLGFLHGASFNLLIVLGMTFVLDFDGWNCSLFFAGGLFSTWKARSMCLAMMVDPARSPIVIIRG